MQAFIDSFTITYTISAMKYNTWKKIKKSNIANTFHFIWRCAGLIHRSSSRSFLRNRIFGVAILSKLTCCSLGQEEFPRFFSLEIKSPSLCWSIIQENNAVVSSLLINHARRQCSSIFFVDQPCKKKKNAVVSSLLISHAGKQSSIIFFNPNKTFSRF